MNLHMCKTLPMPLQHKSEMDLTQDPSSQLQDWPDSGPGLGSPSTVCHMVYNYKAIPCQLKVPVCMNTFNMNSAQSLIEHKYWPDSSQLYTNTARIPLLTSFLGLPTASF